MDLDKKRFSEVHCPLCGEEFRVRKGKPRTLKQWRMALITHLIASPNHRLALDKAELAIDEYFKSLER